MKDSPSPILLLALGNDLLGDDGVALRAARVLKDECNKNLIDVVESSEAGLALMEIMTGYECALLLDSVQTGKCAPGSVIEFTMDDFRKVVAPSPHYAGIPEIFAMAERLGIPFPANLRILALEVVNPYEFRQDMSPEVTEGLPRLIESARRILSKWQRQYSCTNTH